MKLKLFALKGLVVGAAIMLAPTVIFAQEEVQEVCAEAGAEVAAVAAAFLVVPAAVVAFRRRNSKK